VRIHHLNCGSFCPLGARLITGDGGLLEPAEIVCHCLAIETDEGIVLVDTGMGTGDVRNPSQLGRAFGALMRPRPSLETTAVAQLAALGFEAGDVRHIVATHLDLDHSGGLPDFPQAQVHVYAAELEAALRPPLREGPRYIGGAHWRHSPRWVEHETDGDRWEGFESVRILPGLDAEIALVPLVGHSRGHSAVAVRAGDGWLLHCGDAYFHRREVASPPSCPPGLALFQTAMASNLRARRTNLERLRELAARGGEEIRIFCSHDARELEREQARAGDEAAALGR
jgi:glyoxylase-like metal-dependent hydrolase (beta-lactamase superfamily II)